MIIVKTKQEYIDSGCTCDLEITVSGDKSQKWMPKTTTIWTNVKDGEGLPCGAKFFFTGNETIEDMVEIAVKEFKDNVLKSIESDQEFYDRHIKLIRTRF